MIPSNLIAACDRLLQTEREVLSMDARTRDWFLSKPGHIDSFAIAHALKDLLELSLGKKGPQMSETAHSDSDPVEQVAHWIRQYCEHMKAPEVAKALDHAVIFRITRTMFNQGRTLDDLKVIIENLAHGGRKPRGVGWLITVIEGKLGRVA